jgi:hypothetical protein
MSAEHPYDEKRRIEGAEERRATVRIGDVAVILGDPPHANPYRGTSLLGRRAALRGFKLGDLDAIDRYTFWYAPVSGGARRISNLEVDWESSGV